MNESVAAFENFWNDHVYQSWPRKDDWIGQNSITPSEGDVKINTLSNRSILSLFLMLHRVGTFKDSIYSVDLNQGH